MSKLGAYASNFVERREKLALGALLILGLVFMIMWGDLKSSHAFHVDEIWQYSFANSYGQDTWVVTETDLGKWLSPEIFRDFYTVQPGQEFSVKQIMESAEKDLHPPFSHILLNIVSSFFPNGFSKWFGLSINIAAYMGTIWALYLLSKLLFATKLRAWLATATWAFSLGAVDTVVYIRMYCLLTLFSVCLFLFSVQYLRSGQKKYLVGIFLSILLGGLTEYIFWILGFFTTLSFMLFHYRHNLKQTIAYASVSLSSLIVACIIFPATVTQFTNQDSMTHYANDVFGLEEKLKLLLDPVYALNRFLHFSSMPVFGFTTGTFFFIMKLILVLALVSIIFLFFASMIMSMLNRITPEKTPADGIATHINDGAEILRSAFRQFGERIRRDKNRYTPVFFIMLAVLLTTYTLAVVFPDFQEWTVRAFFYVFPFYAMLFAGILCLLHDKLRVPGWILFVLVFFLFMRSNTSYISPFLLQHQYEKLRTKLKDTSVIMALDSEGSIARMPNFCPPLSDANGVYLLLLNKANCATEMFKAIHTAPPDRKIMVINTVGGPPENLSAAMFLGPEMLLTSNKLFMDALARDGLNISLIKKFGSLFQTFHLYEISRKNNIEPETAG